MAGTGTTAGTGAGGGGVGAAGGGVSNELRAERPEESNSWVAASRLPSAFCSAVAACSGSDATVVCPRWCGGGGVAVVVWPQWCDNTHCGVTVTVTRAWCDRHGSVV